MSYSGLSDLELGKAASTTKLHRLAALLDVDVNYLETGKGASGVAEPTAQYGSHSLRLDPEIVRDVARALQEVYAEDLGRVYSITEEPELFVDLYERVLERGKVDTRSNMVWLGSRIGKAPQGATRDERSEGVHGESHAADKVGAGGSKS